MVIEGLSVGRIVHYVGHESDACRAAIIAQVLDDETGVCNLVVFRDDTASSVELQRERGCDEGKGVHTWHWPEGAPTRESRRPVDDLIARI
jgi:hypothetical protein